MRLATIDITAQPSDGELARRSLRRLVGLLSKLAFINLRNFHQCFEETKLQGFVSMNRD